MNLPWWTKSHATISQEEFTLRMWHTESVKIKATCALSRLYLIQMTQFMKWVAISNSIVSQTQILVPFTKPKRTHLYTKNKRHSIAKKRRPLWKLIWTQADFVIKIISVSPKYVTTRAECASARTKEKIVYRSLTAMLIWLVCIIKTRSNRLAR
jgi:hypothetical protein